MRGNKEGELRSTALRTKQRPEFRQPVVEKANGFGILGHAVDDVFPERAAARSLVAEGPTADGDTANRAATERDPTDRQTSESQ